MYFGSVGKVRLRTLKLKVQTSNHLNFFIESCNINSISISKKKKKKNGEPREHHLGEVLSRNVEIQD